MKTRKKKPKPKICVCCRFDPEKLNVKYVEFELQRGETKPDGQQVKTTIKPLVCAPCLFRLGAMANELMQSGALPAMLAQSGVRFEQQNRIITPRQAGKIVPAILNPKKPS